MDSTVKTILLIFFFVMVFYLLSVLSYILIPLVLAFLVASLFAPLIWLLKKLKFPKWLIIPTISIITLGVIYLLFIIISNTVADIAANKEYLIERLNLRYEELLDWINATFGQRLRPRILSRNVSNMFDKDLISAMAGGVASSVGSFTGSFFMFALYFIFLLSGMTDYKQYITYVGGNPSSHLLENYERVQKSIFRYMFVKTMINIGIGLIVWGICYAFGLPFAIFWGFLTFMLHYIPNIGSIMAVVFPGLMALIHFDTFREAFLIIMLITVISFLVGNVLEPKIMGTTLSINTMTVLIGLVFWGYLWGIPGTMISVPLLVVLKIIFENIPSMQIFARMMGSPAKAGT